MAILRLPAEEREWLTLAEAAAHVGHTKNTIRNWRIHAVLPHTQTVSQPVGRLWPDPEN